MKHFLLTTIAAVVLVGCGPQAPDLSIQHATTLAKIEIIKQHIAAKTDINEKDSYGRTPLLCAITQGHEEIAELLIAELLIANGAEVNAQADSGRTPLDYALHSFKTRELLRKHGGKTWEELKAEGK